ncbi:hypothetical protein [Actinomyces ruminis]|nr:hypothetical protein [Actinomyces ruminis]
MCRSESRYELDFPAYALRRLEVTDETAVLGMLPTGVIGVNVYA